MLRREERSPDEWNRNTYRYKRSKPPRRGRTSRPDIAEWDATGTWGFAWGPLSATRSSNANVHFVHFICRAPQPKHALSSRAPPVYLKPASRTPYPPDAGSLINPADAGRFRMKAISFADCLYGGGDIRSSFRQPSFCDQSPPVAEFAKIWPREPSIDSRFPYSPLPLRLVPRIESPSADVAAFTSRSTQNVRPDQRRAPRVIFPRPPRSTG